MVVHFVLLRYFECPVWHAYFAHCGNDDSVTFRYYAPYAKSVLVNGQFMVGDIPLIKDDKGVWSVTVKPEKADIYPYNFIVDGTRLNDPGNKLLSPTDAFKSSLLEMPDPDALYTINPVLTAKCTIVLIVRTCCSSIAR